MKKILALILAMVMALSLAACGKTEQKDEKKDDNAAAKTFIMGIDAEYPPFSYIDENGEYTGFDVEVCKAACDLLGWDMQVFPVNWDQKLVQLDANECDCVWSGMTILDSMKEAGYVLSAPYYDNTQVIMVKEGSDIKSSADLAGKVVAVQQAVIAPAGGNVQLPFLGHHIVQHVRVHARGVDHIPGLEVPAVRMNGPAAAASGETRYLCIEPEFHAVGISVLRQGNGHVKGADDTAGGGPQGGHGVLADIGLHFVKPFTVYNFQPLHTVLHAVFIKGLKSRHILLRHADHQGTIHLEWKVQIPGKLGHHSVAPHIHFCHKTSVGSVKARVDNGAVSLGGAAAHILRPLQNQHFSLVAGKIPGHRAAGDTGADNNYIVQMERLLQQKSGSPRKPSGRRGWAARHLH